MKNTMRLSNRSDDLLLTRLAFETSRSRKVEIRHLTPAHLLFWFLIRKKIALSHIVLYENLSYCNKDYLSSPLIC